MHPYWCMTDLHVICWKPKNLTVSTAPSCDLVPWLGRNETFVMHGYKIVMWTLWTRLSRKAKKFSRRDRPDCYFFQWFKEHIHIPWLGISFLCSHSGRPLHSRHISTFYGEKVNASVNSSGAHLPPGGTLSVPGVGHSQFYGGRGGWALAYLGAIPGHLTHVFSKLGKKETFVKDWLVRQGLEKLVDVF